MEERIATELELLRKYYPMLVFNPEGNWIKIPDYRMPAGVSWNKTSIDVCFQIIAGYPATPPYGIYVPSDLKCNGEEPLNFQRVANNKPRFDGEWGMLSWTPENGK